jgi:hypothetical protein
MDDMKIINFPELKHILESLEKPKISITSDPTYFEIAGYPSLENVASNILGFLLDPTEIHGFNTLFLESLLFLLNCPYTPDDFVDIDVEREVITDQKCRIDIAVSTNSKLIAIENKLFASLNNDLNHYISHLKKISNGKEVYGCLLSLYPIKIPETVLGFVNITYEQFFNTVLGNTGGKLLEANNRYISLLTEFIKTINNLRRENPMSNPEFVNWLADNEQLGNRLIQEINAIKKDLTSKAKKLGQMLDLAKYQENNIKITQWIWDAFHYGEKIIAMDLVHDIEINGLKINIDTMIRPSGITMEIWERSEKIVELKEFLSKKKIQTHILEDETILFGKKLPYDSNLEIAREQLQELLNNII